MLKKEEVHPQEFNFVVRIRREFLAIPANLMFVWSLCCSSGLILWFDFVV